MSKEDEKNEKMMLKIGKFAEVVSICMDATLDALEEKIGREKLDEEGLSLTDINLIILLFASLLYQGAQISKKKNATIFERGINELQSMMGSIDGLFYEAMQIYTLNVIREEFEGLAETKKDNKGAFMNISEAEKN